jgi:LmbE family N-acetylglucosaminyl deacetylase
MNFFGKRILLVGAHPDDIELGCGAFLHQVQPHNDVLCLTLSDNQKNPNLSDIVSEHFASFAVLGVPESKIILEKFETRKFPEQRQDILEYLLKIRKDYSPDLVLVHTRSDIHQDHNVVTEESLRAYRGTTVLGFDVVRSSYGFFPHFLVGVSEEDVDMKVKALSEYKTYHDKYYFNADLLRATMIRHGALAEKKFAEGFDILRIVADYYH